MFLDVSRLKQFPSSNETMAIPAIPRDNGDDVDPDFNPNHPLDPRPIPADAVTFHCTPHRLMRDSESSFSIYLANGEQLPAVHQREENTATIWYIHLTAY